VFNLWTFLAVLLFAVLACLAIFIGLLRVARRWGEEAIELQRHGIEVTGTVIEKRSYRSRRQQSTHIRYEYVDQFGKRHRSRRNLVTPEAWNAHHEGGSIQVIYSVRRPAISLPKYLIDLAPEK
jgi:hypothetical protein